MLTERRKILKGAKVNEEKDAFYRRVALQWKKYSCRETFRGIWSYYFIVDDFVDTFIQIAADKG